MNESAVPASARISLARHARQREALLEEVTRTLTEDPVELAVWLTGSLAAGTADAWSDIDLHAVIDDSDYPRIVAERHTLFARFGTPLLAQQLKGPHTDGPSNFTLLLYPGIIELDFSFWPLSRARRPPWARLLFDRAGVPVLDPWSPAERRRIAQERLDFFWAMTAVTIKCIGRGYSAGAAELLTMMRGAFDTLWRIVHRPDDGITLLMEPRHRPRIAALAAINPPLGPAITPARCAALLRNLMAVVESLHPALARLDVTASSDLAAELDALLALAGAAMPQVSVDRASDASP